jgi:hypothetical protein
MLKRKILMLFALLLAITLLVIARCDSYPIDINVKQSIRNINSDTIIIFNSLKEFKGIAVDTIICLPNTENIFFNCTLTKQPLEPYNVPLVYEGSIIYTSSGRKLVKDIFDNSNWDFIKNSKQEWLIFTITESDLE